MSRGLTLLELLLTIAIMAVVMGIGIVSVNQVRVIYQLWNSVDSIKTLAKTAREWSVIEREGREYVFGLSGGVVTVKDSGGQEWERYVLPTNVSVTPSSFSWQFAALSGRVSGCSPCSLTVNSSGESQIINIGPEGSVE